MISVLELLRNYEKSRVYPSGDPGECPECWGSSINHYKDCELKIAIDALSLSDVTIENKKDQNEKN